MKEALFDFNFGDNLLKVEANDTSGKMKVESVWLIDDDGNEAAFNPADIFYRMPGRTQVQRLGTTLFSIAMNTAREV